MATRDAADAIGRPDLGRLTPGSRADMVALSLEHPAFHPVVPDEDDMVSRLVWGATPAAVETVWVNGRVVVDGGGVRTVDVPGALADVAARARRLAR
jgi:5-methylthioadenosine/S-adenosylhomocysteine deaminase